MYIDKQKILLVNNIDSSEPCPNCNNKNSMSVFLSYTHSSMLFVFGYVCKRKYFINCKVCEKCPSVLDKKSELIDHDQIKISLWERYAILIPITGGLIWGLIEYFGG